MTEISTKDNHDFFIRQNCDRSIRLGIGKVNRQTLVLSFRGTKNLSNVLTDLNFAPIKWDVAQGIKTMEMEDEEANENDIKVHRGFLEAYCSIQAAIQGLFMGNFMNGVETVIFTGHSLGGALASICALDFRRMAGIAGNNNLKYHLITFGSPRVGNQIFANNINGMMDVNMRVVFEDDIVPQVPDKPYVHPGDLVVVKSNDDVVITRRLDEGDSSERYVDIDENEINTKSVLLKSLEAGCIEGAKYITSFFCTLPKDEKPFLKKVTDHSKYKSISAETLESMYNIYANLTPNFNQMKKKLRRRKNRKLLRKR
eukprot:CAMPEP_0170514894 /NCGR_PEP_ID=MMETSP0209-20121228/1405_1 /TAXON_ID=665100 ORGANISM="Litonotus pictus, Strain P1" /NCGR_SAMPLE_ID=MMETSP0209 /ASSEMBLY_ACC=CAM_ASM_000301 /LENGTH=312 /DNA_ID=CAMNT_0010799155 /DNA_START=165 /DNA_END=1103 /DNA_ORIENTATION=+